jgi:hypothetical protein
VGITAANMRISDPNGTTVYSTFMYKTAGTNQNGTWTNDWAISCQMPVGNYRVSVQVVDAAGNTTGWVSIPGFRITANTTQDLAAPVFVSGLVSPGPIVVGQTIPEVSARITDDIGVKTVTFTLTDPRGWSVGTMVAYRSSGTKQDGVYKNDWATKTTFLSGRYKVYVEAVDEWQKKIFREVGTIDINPIPATTPTPAPVVGDAAMVVTPYRTASLRRNSSLSTAANSTLKAKSSGYFIASTLFASGQNSGLLSLGHLLEVSTSTLAICSVSNVITEDRTGGIFTRATVNALTAGTCTVTWRFLGFKGRATTSTIMDVTVTN